MAIPSRSDLSAAETLARTGGAPMLFGAERLRSWIGDPRDTGQAIAMIATSTGGIPNMSDTDTPDPDFPIINLCDGSMTSISKPAWDAGVKQIGWVFDFGESKEIDILVIKLGESVRYANTTVTIWLSDDPNFGAGNYSQVATKTFAFAGSTKRMVFDTLGNGTDGYGRWTARYMSIAIERGGSVFTLLQSISEAIVGRRRQFSFGPSLPFSPTGYQAGWEDIETKAGYTYRRRLYSSRQTRRGTVQLADFTAAGLLDDSAQFDALMTDCDFGCEKVGYSTVGSTEDETRENCVIGYLADGSIDAAYDGPIDRQWSLDLTESAPFVSEES